VGQFDFHNLQNSANWHTESIMPDRSRTRPRDPNELAHNVFLESIGERPKTEPPKEKNPAAVALGRLGGLKGGVARAAALTPKKRSQMAAKAAKARWGNK
jgi:hypothetical protein